ncbi:MAG: UDP-N-acetylmuramoyl-L-alanine--D-glutamate ligase [Planctomycetota bacterium]
MGGEQGGARAPLCGRQELAALTDDLAGRRVTLMGLGTFGGGVGAATFLARRGARLTVTDLRTEAELRPSVEALRDLPVRYRLGGHRERDFARADLVVASPAVPRANRFLRAAHEAGARLTSPMNIFLALCRAPIAAVTGSNGKSTTTALLAHMLKSAGHTVWLGGNIGISLLPELDRIGPAHQVVLELSSFQLQDAGALRWSPPMAVVTNITPNHLDRHGCFEEYAAAKRGILRHQRPGDYAVLNARDRTTGQWAREDLPARPVGFDLPAEDPRPGTRLRDGRVQWADDEGVCELFAAADLPLPGRHNLQNAMAAAAAARCMGAGAAEMVRALRNFGGLGHRLELVRTLDGVRYYNDSYSTTPESTVAALRSFDAPTTLIAGGYDKMLDLSPIARAAAEAAEVVVTFGQTGPVLAGHCRRRGGESLVVREAPDLGQALREAKQRARPGSVVVFSPGCASYDMFENCRRRGEEFCRLVWDKPGNDAGPGRCA